MRHLTALLALVTSSASASPVFSELFVGKPETVEARCVEGEKDAVNRPRPTPENSKDMGALAAAIKQYTNYLNTLSKDRDFGLTEGTTLPMVYLQTHYGSVFNSCNHAAKALETRPPLSSIARGVIVFARGQVSELRQAKDWKVVLVFKDSSGKEIKRLTPDTTIAGTVNDWKANCSPSPCKFVGTNTYYFKATDDVLKAAETASQLSILTSLGNYGIKSYDLTPEMVQEKMTRK